MAATEEMLIARTLDGDTRAFDQLVQRHQPWLHGRALATIGHADESEDVVQEVFCRAFEQLASLREPDRFGAWLLSILKRITISQWRRRTCWQRVEADLSEGPVAGPPQPDECYEQRETQERLARILAEMPENYRSAVQLFYYEYMSYNEMADLLGLKVDTAKYRLIKGRKYLRRRLVRKGTRYANA